MNPFARNQRIICHNGELGTWVNGQIVPVFWWRDQYWPVSGAMAFNLLARDARSCTRVTRIDTTPFRPGGVVKVVNNGRRRH